VGAGHLGSAVGMDKDVTKRLLAHAGIPVVPWRVCTAAELRRDPDALAAKVASLGFPLFIKPANAGSSVGVTKVKTLEGLSLALHTAFSFDRKALAEAAVDAREIECAVLGNDDPATSLPGEILPSREFYDYEAKYLDEGSKTVIPANLAPDVVLTVQRLAIECFKAVDAAGLARVDFLMAGDSGQIFANEINTMPGFTTISMYSKMWEATGLSYTALVDRLIQLALERHQEKQGLKTSAL
jgi:D-alanine-D-alanine ligase